MAGVWVGVGVGHRAYTVSTPVVFAPSLQFNDARNSQYLFLWLW